MAAIWPEATGPKLTNSCSQIWRFYNRMQVGDTVFVRAYGALLGIGKIVGDYQFLREGDELRKEFYSPYFDDSYPHVREVNWVSLWGGMKQALAVTKLTVVKVVGGKPQKVED
jgi:predicted Mrr-cat superfamily restriction endonuclease